MMKSINECKIRKWLRQRNKLFCFANKIVSSDFMPKIESVHWQMKDLQVSWGVGFTSGKLFKPLRSWQSPLCWQKNLSSPSRNFRRDLCSFRRQCRHFVVVDNVPLISTSITWLCHTVRVNMSSRAPHQNKKFKTFLFLSSPHWNLFHYSRLRFWHLRHLKLATRLSESSPWW